MVTVARILNQMDSPYRLKEGDYFATAEPVMTYREPAARSSTSSDPPEVKETNRATGESEWKWRLGQAHRRPLQAAINKGEAAPAGAESPASDYSHVASSTGYPVFLPRSSGLPPWSSSSRTLIFSPGPSSTSGERTYLNTGLIQGTIRLTTSAYVDIRPVSFHKLMLMWKRCLNMT